MSLYNLIENNTKQIFGYKPISEDIQPEQKSEIPKKRKGGI